MPEPLDPEILLAALPPAPAGYLIACSGGLDSTVLLHLMASLRPAAGLRALHVHHGLQPAADGWAAHCRALCAGWGVPFGQADVQPVLGAGISLEAAARDARYAALQAALRPGEVLLTAHHLDDQAETLLLQLLRGAGLRGLAAMPALAELPPGWHARPLLGVPRAALADYARRHGLRWVEDPSNADPRHPRNRLRHEVLPRLRELNPRACELIARSAGHCAEAAAVLDGIAASDLAGCRDLHDSLSVTRLLALAPARRRNLLRHWLEVRGLPLPQARHLRQIERDLLPAAADAMPLVAWPGAELRRYRSRLHAMAPLPARNGQGPWPWTPGREQALPAGCGRLHSEPCSDGSGLRAPRAEERCELRLPQGGERLQLPGRVHHHALKDVLQRAGVPPWVRQRLPLLYYDGRIAAVADLLVCEGFCAAAGEAGWRLAWQEPPPGHPGPAAAGPPRGGARGGHAGYLLE